MARTFIGELVLKLQDQMSAGAKRAAATTSSALRDIERNADRLGKAQWGVSFQRQLDRLGVSGRELDTVKRSWADLHRSMASQNLNKTLQKSNISAWRVSTLQHFSAVRAGMQATAASARNLQRTMATLIRPGYIMAGGYTGGYVAATLGREALKAASEGQRQQAQANYAGLSGGEQQQIKSVSDALAMKYRLFDAQVFEMVKDAALNMPSTDVATKVAEPMAKALLVLQNLFDDKGAAVEGLRRFNRAMDNIEKIQPEEYTRMLEGYIKAQQVIGKDMDPGAFEEAIKYSRSAGKVHSEEFLTTWLPQFISQLGGSNAGTVTRAAFDQFIVGRASKQALKQQEAYGLRGKDGSLINEELFGQNPVRWMAEVLMPQLKKAGVDVEDEVELARVVGQLTNNRMSSDFVMTALLSYDQMLRVADRMKKASGLSAADTVQDKDPFASWQGLKDSLSNLAAATVPIQTIAAGLNNLADTINRLSAAVNANPTFGGMAALGGGAVAAFGAYKAGQGVWALITAGVSLQTAATMLQSAAIAQGGGGALGGMAKKGGMLGALSMPQLLAGGAIAGGSVYAIRKLSEANHKGNLQPAGKRYDQGAAQNAANNYRQFHGVHFEGGRHRAYAGAGPLPNGDSGVQYISPTGGPRGRLGPRRELAGNATPFPTPRPDFNAAVQESKQAGAEIESNLSVTATPQVDSSSIDIAIAKARQLLGLLQSAGAASARAVSSANAANQSLRSSLSDFGVSPE